MSNVTLNPTSGGKGLQRTIYDAISPKTFLSVSFEAGGTIQGSYAVDSGSATGASVSGTMDALHIKTNVANAFSLSGVRFSRSGIDNVVKADGSVQINPSPVTGNGTTVGTMTPAQGEVVLNSWVAGSTPVVTNWRGVAAAPINGVGTPFSTYAVTFRVATAPLRTGSLSILGSMQDGTTFNVTADSDGIINSTRIKGRVNYTTGVVQIVGVTPTGTGGQTQADISFLNIPSVTTAYIDLIQQETIRYNAVAYTYLPLDPTLLGLDPVRLPTDGRVPIFRSAGFVVIGEKFTSTPATASNGGTVNTGQTRLSRVRVIGQNGATISTGYSVDLEAGIVTWNDVTGYSQPVKVESRIEDMAQLKDAAIDGTLTLLRALTHNFSTNAYVSSAYVVGDTKARVSLLFDQATFSPQVFADAINGSDALGTYNNIGYPPIVTNRGAVTERWALLFKTTQTVDIIGEHLGVIATGVSINTDIAPANPQATGSAPFFTFPAAGFGSGWAIGNVIRFNTVGAIAPLWLARTIKQGPAAGPDYSFTLLARGDIDNPL